jgi:hypothetical protein
VLEIFGEHAEKAILKGRLAVYRRMEELAEMTGGDDRNMWVAIGADIYDLGGDGEF